MQLEIFHGPLNCSTKFYDPQKRPWNLRHPQIGPGPLNESLNDTFLYRWFGFLNDSDLLKYTFLHWWLFWWVKVPLNWFLIQKTEWILKSRKETQISSRDEAIHIDKIWHISIEVHLRKHLVSNCKEKLGY